MEENKEPTANEQNEAGAAGGEQAQAGGPDPRIAASKYREERDAARQQAADLTTQLEALRKSTEGLKSAEDVQAAVDEALAKAQADYDASKAKWHQRERSLAVGMALTQAGCIDPTAAVAHVDMDKVEIDDKGDVKGLDLESMKTSYPYLFGVRRDAGKTGLDPDGAADGDAALAKARAQFGLKGQANG